MPIFGFLVSDPFILKAKISPVNIPYINLLLIASGAYSAPGSKGEMREGGFVSYEPVSFELEGIISIVTSVVVCLLSIQDHRQTLGELNAVVFRAGCRLSRNRKVVVAEVPECLIIQRDAFRIFLLPERHLPCHIYISLVNLENPRMDRFLVGSPSTKPCQALVNS